MPIRKVVTEDTGVPVKIWTDDVDDLSVEQLRKVARLPFVHRHVAAMPDVHGGKGSTVGAVIATRNAIVPAAVGVDIGCGMMAVRLSLTASQLPDSLRDVRSAIESVVPLGAGGRHDAVFPRREPRSDGNVRRGERLLRLRGKLAPILGRHNGIVAKMTNDELWALQLGSLGSGNHFIEVCLDESDGVWIVLHSGSRGIGNRIGQYFIDKALEECRKWHIPLEDPDLAYLPQGTPLFDDYWEALTWAQEYAALNREEMMERILAAIRAVLPSFEVLEGGTNCHHNYCTLENHFGRNVYVTRKGAIRAREGDIGIVPGSMGTATYIVRGKGNPESFCSCAHGAGRRMSRRRAKNVFTVEDLMKQTEGVECRKDVGVLDEIPAAYKDIEQVMANQEDLVEVVHRLRQIVNVKG